LKGYWKGLWVLVEQLLGFWSLFAEFNRFLLSHRSRSGRYEQKNACGQDS
jgi:hypothetical protein